MKRGNILAAIGLSVAMTAALLTGCGSSDKLDGSKVAGTVNDDEVTLGELSFVTRYQQALTYSYYSQLFGSSNIFDTVSDEDTGETVGEQMVDSIMDSLDELLIIKQHADDYDVSLTDDETAKIDETAQTYIDNNGEDVLDRIGASKEDVVNYLTWQTIKAKVMQAAVTDVDTNVTEEESNQTGVTIIRLALDDDSERDALEADMQAIYEALQAEPDLLNADVLSIAKTVNEDATKVSNSYTTSDPTDTTLDSNAVDAVKDKAAGELSDSYFESADGSYLMIAFNEGHDADRTETKVKTIISDRKQEVYDDLLASWKEEANIVHNDDVIKLVVVTDSVAYAEVTSESSEESTDTTDSTESSSAESSAEESSAEESGESDSTSSEAE